MPMRRLPRSLFLALLPALPLGCVAGPPAQRAEGSGQKAVGGPEPASLLPTAFCLLPSEQAADPAPAPGKPDFARDVRPLLNKYCIDCHNARKRKGNLSLEGFTDEAAALKDPKVWEKVADNLRSGDMPPQGRKRPAAEELDAVNAWIDLAVFKVDCTGQRDPGRVTIRRLNRVEYNNTIRDLVGIDFRPADDFPADDVGYGFDNIGDVLSLPPLLLEKYLNAAEQVVDRAFRDPKVRDRLLNPPANPKFPNEKGPRAAIRAFASRAYRRPATEDEVRRLTGFVLNANRTGDSPQDGVKLAFTAVLVSPHFLFRIEEDPKDGAVVRRISDYELATRLSYFLWSSMPDDELFRLAEEGKLREPGVLEGQVKRMLADPKSRALADNFAGQWLQIRALRNLQPDPKLFPGFDDRLRADMSRETELYFEHVMREDRSVLELIDGDYTFVNERLAKHYGLPGVRGEEFRKVTLPDRRRGGVLTQASVLTVTSNPTRTSPVKRGKYILENILGTPPPPPPPEVAELKDDKPGAVLTGTLRQRMEQHRADPNCAVCHQKMDPLGFGFENFDAVGRWRELDGKEKVDASGVLPGGQEFDGPGELRVILLGRKDVFVRCLADKMLTYALGRGTERSDRCYIEDIAKAMKRDDYRFSALVIEIVKSEPFQMRRARKGQP
jgi:mono/diheme cytochrome c family protein